MTTTPPVDNDAKLATAVSDFLDTRTATWAEVQAIARLAENGMAAQADEHAIELRRAWSAGRTAGATGSCEANPYPELTPASAEVVIDGDVFTWRQLPEYVGRLLIRLREAEHDAKQVHIDAVEQHSRTVVLDEVSAERDRQIAKWGHQHHPTGTGPYVQPFTFPHSGSRFVGNDFAILITRIFTAETDAAAQTDECTWRDILLEEVFEALAEATPEGLRHELIQVAGVAVTIAQEIDAGQIVEPK